MTSFYKILIIFIVMIPAVVTVSCKQKRSVKEKVIVEKPAEMDAEVNENIQDILKYATDNNGRLTDSVKLLLLTAVQAFYDQNEYKNVWSKDERWQPLADSMYEFIQHSEWYGLFPNDYHLKSLQEIRSRLEKDSVAKTDAIVWSRADLLLTDAFMEILRDLKKGRLLPDSILSDAVKKSAGDFFVKNLNAAVEIKSLTAVFDSVEPRHSAYRDLKSGLPQFLDNMDRKTYTYLTYPYKDSISFIKSLRKRLLQGGYIDSALQSLDSVQLSNAIKKVQKKKGIRPDGKLSASVVKLLNDTDVEKFKRIAVTLDRYKQLPATFPEKYIWVNLPGFYLKVVENDSSVLWSKVIVGKAATRTPLFNTFITDMVTYPQWTIPNSIIKKDILPALKRDPGYLYRKGFSLVDLKGELINPYSIKWAKYTKGIPYKIRQGSGDDNALGIFKFNFYNRYNIYLHDTNERYLFKKSMRALSHGCVRVQQWDSLAFYIAKNDSLNSKPEDTLKYNTDSLKVWLANKERKRVVVRNKLPLFIQYFTCEGRKGKIIFYDDIYDEDKLLKEKYFASK